MMLVMFCLLPLGAWAQGVVKGTVNDETGEPVIGASVRVIGTKTGGVTDINGQFSVTADRNAQLEVSYVGFVSQRVAVNGRQNINIVLREDNTTLNDVVVIGYGTQRREAVTGSVANIGGEKLNEIAATNAAQALQGRVAGVLMTQTGSKPGDEMQIRIRAR